MRLESIRKPGRRRFGSALATLGLLLVSGVDPAEAPAVPAGGRAEPFCAASPVGRAGPDPYAIVLAPTARANGASGVVRLRFSASPFGLAVSRDGHHAYDVEVSTTGLRQAAGALVAWAATPELDQVRKLGVLGGDGALRARVEFNKFLVFVTLEPSRDVERWSGPILLRGISPSGRMHSLAGHGPFAGEPCATLSPF